MTQLISLPGSKNSVKRQSKPNKTITLEEQSLALCYREKLSHSLEHLSVNLQFKKLLTVIHQSQARERDSTCKLAGSVWKI